MQQEAINKERYNRIRTLAEGNERLMLEGLNQIPDLIAANAVMLLGRTGSGKSAFINLLAGKPLFARRNENTLELVLDSLDMLPGITIGNEHPSETSVPHSWKYNANTIYWDCPGFSDNRGLEYEIANAFLIKKLFDAHQTCKVVIVIADSDINDPRITHLLSAVRALDAFFQSDIDRIRQGLMLVVSGVNPAKTAAHIQGTLQNITNAPGFALTDSQKELFRIVMNNSIIMFKKPVAEGSFDISCREEYLEKIENLGVINDLHVRSIISSDSNLVILDTYVNLLRSINLEIDNLMSNLSLQLRSAIARSQESQNIQELSITITGLQEISDRFGNDTVLSNRQLLLEIVPECMQLNINRSMEQTALNLRTMLYKTEIFDFLEQLIDCDARLKLGIEAAITAYLSNCTRDANFAIQAIEQRRAGENIVTLQFDLQRESAARIESEEKTKTLEQQGIKNEKEIKTLKQEVDYLRNRPSGGGGGGCSIL